MTQATTEQAEERPSSARRKALREADAGNLPIVSNFFPLERYYEASEKVLASFEQAMQVKDWDDAYVYGMRYCMFCVQGIPQHDYYQSPKTRSLQIKSKRQVDKVLEQLEAVADAMDAQEVERQALRQAKLKEMEAQRLAQQEAQLQAWNQRIQAQKQDSTTNSTSTSVEESALAKLHRLAAATQTNTNGGPGPETPTATTTTTSSTDPEGQSPPGEKQTTTSLQDLQPLLPPSGENDSDPDAPPSYAQASALRSSFFGPGRDSQQQQDSTSATTKKSVSFGQDQIKLIPGRSPPSTTKRGKNAAAFVDQVQRNYHRLLQSQEIQVSALGTHQGRKSGSTNGCTVISALCASKHLQTAGGLTTAQANQVIDAECVPLLKEIRSKLSLGESSLIIPSDVHDHLVDKHLLHQHKFLGATGGNLLEEDHLQSLLDLLEGTETKTQAYKAAATLFYKEHVISVVKFPTSPTTAVYDLIDSLPRSSTNGCGSRTRCHSRNALKTLLWWYALSKLHNPTSIVSKAWDESMADFDPRVFQAFVWADIPMPKQ